MPSVRVKYRFNDPSGVSGRRVRRLSHKKWGGFRLYDILTDRPIDQVTE